MDDDFTFPTVAAPVPAPTPAPEEQHNLEEVPLPGRLRSPITSPIWPFSSAPKTKNTQKVEEADAPSTSTRIGFRGHAQAVRQHDDEDRMDLLWEDLNDNLKLPRRRRPESSDTESEETSAGCAPTTITMLRVSSRAGGAGQFCSGTSRSGRGSRTTGWALLLRLFQRLFAVDKRPPSRSPRHHHHGIYAP